MMINKIVKSMAEAIGDLRDGSTVLLGGFGSVGQPQALLAGLIEHGAKELTIVSNGAGGFSAPGDNLGRLLELGRVRKMICTFPKGPPGSRSTFEKLYEAGKIELELVPQGTLTERVRAAGAGIPAFYTATSAGTRLAEGKETRRFGERDYVMETALKGDLALVQAWRGDRWGNLVYRQSARNHNPVMATGAARTAAQVNHLVDLGELDPEAVVTPGIFVDTVIHVPDAPA